MASGRAIVALIAAFAVAIHLPWIDRYGFHGDELYFIACGQRLDWGYVDHPPLIAGAARLATVLFGDGVWALRVLPLAAHALTVWLVGSMARQLGAQSWGQAIAALSFAVAPVFVVSATFLNIPCFEACSWALAAWLLLRILSAPAEVSHTRSWLALGAVLGVGLLTKHTTSLFGFGILVGLLASPARRLLKTPGPWLAAAVAAALFSPNLLWQVRHGWPTVHFIVELNAHVMSRVSRTDFLLGQILFLGPMTAPLWLAGLVHLLRRPALRPLGVGYLVMAVVLLIVQAKVYYLAPAYPVLFAAGGAAAEVWARRRRWWRWGLPSVLIAFCALFYPIVTPVLPVEQLDPYTDRVIGFALATPRDVTQELHRQVGWSELIDQLDRADDQLSAGERARAVVLTASYSQAGAVERWGPERGLPRAVSAHMSYFLWGPGDDPEVALAVGMGEGTLARLFVDCRQVATLGEHDNPELHGAAIHLCRRPRAPLSQTWPSLRR